MHLHKTCKLGKCTCNIAFSQTACKPVQHVCLMQAQAQGQADLHKLVLTCKHCTAGSCTAVGKGGRSSGGGTAANGGTASALPFAPAFALPSAFPTAPFPTAGVTATGGATGNCGASGFRIFSRTDKQTMPLGLLSVLNMLLRTTADCKMAAKSCKSLL